MGGGFGAKNGAPHATYIAAALAKKTGRPVRCILDREGEQTDAGNRPATIQRVTIGAKRDGTLTAIDARRHHRARRRRLARGPGARSITSCIAARTFAASETFVYTNTARWRRSARRATSKARSVSSARWTSLARELGIDPLELRRRNYARRRSGQGPSVLRQASRRVLHDWAPSDSGGTRARKRTATDGSRSPRRRAWRRSRGARAADRRRTRRFASTATARSKCSPARRTSAPARARSSRRSPPKSLGAKTRGRPHDPRRHGAAAVRVELVGIDHDGVGRTGRARRGRGGARSLFEAAAEMLGTRARRARVARQRDPREEQRQTACYVQRRLREARRRDDHRPGEPRSESRRDGDRRVRRAVRRGRSRRRDGPRARAAHRLGARLRAHHQSDARRESARGRHHSRVGICAVRGARRSTSGSGVPLNPTMHDYKIPTIGDMPAIDAFFVDARTPSRITRAPRVWRSRRSSARRRRSRMRWRMRSASR